MTRHLIKKSVLWSIWLLITLALLTYYGLKMTVADDKEALLIGEASHGHFQIQLACDSCHTEAFGGGEVIQEACEGCHAEELKSAHDSHPKKKFTDPRNADRLEVIDARYCVSCHTEHQAEQTHPMGVTVPEDYCFHCHQDIAEERISHQGLEFDSCASAGCHNYHDNRALYEDFLVENSSGEWLTHSIQDAISQPDDKSNSEVLTMLDSHHTQDVPCGTCHQGVSEIDPLWNPKPDSQSCESCHSEQYQGYVSGKHGMRIAQGLSAVEPVDSVLDFHSDTAAVSHSCSACHVVHEPDVHFSSVQSCLSCHSDSHSASYLDSPHGKAWMSAKQGQLEIESVVTCATCHMPQLDKEHGSGTQHNQNDNLRPNEKMIRSVCMDCHSLGFSIDALADKDLIENNFNGRPGKHVPSVDWALERSNR